MSDISLLKSAFKEDLHELIQESIMQLSPDELLSLSPLDPQHQEEISAFPTLVKDEQDSSNYEIIKLFQAPIPDDDNVEETPVSLPISHLASPSSTKKASPVMITLKLVDVDIIESDDS